MSAGNAVPTPPPASLPTKYSIWHVFASVVTGKSLFDVAHDERVAKANSKALWPNANVDNLKKRCLTIVKAALRGFSTLHTPAGLEASQQAVSSHQDIMTASFPIALRLMAAFPELATGSKPTARHIQGTYLHSRLEVTNLLASMVRANANHIPHVAGFLIKNRDTLSVLTEVPFNDWPVMLQALESEPSPPTEETEDLMTIHEEDSESVDDHEQGSASNRIHGVIGAPSTVTERAALFEELCREALSFSCVQGLQGLTCLGSPYLPVISGFIPHPVSDITDSNLDQASNVASAFLEALTAETGLFYVTRHSSKVNLHPTAPSGPTVVSSVEAAEPAASSSVRSAVSATPLMHSSTTPDVVCTTSSGPSRPSLSSAETLPPAETATAASMPSFQCPISMIPSLSSVDSPSSASITISTTVRSESFLSPSPSSPVPFPSAGRSSIPFLPLVGATALSFLPAIALPSASSTPLSTQLIPVRYSPTSTLVVLPVSPTVPRGQSTPFPQVFPTMSVASVPFLPASGQHLCPSPAGESTVGSESATGLSVLVQTSTGPSTATTVPVPASSPGSTSLPAEQSGSLVSVPDSATPNDDSGPVVELVGSMTLMHCRFGPNYHKLLDDREKTRKGATTRKENCPSAVLFLQSATFTYVFWMPRHSHATDAVHLIGADMEPTIYRFLLDQLLLHNSVQSLRHVLHQQLMVWRNNPDHPIHGWDNSERFNPSDQKLANMLNSKDKTLAYHRNDCMSTKELLLKYKNREPDDHFHFIPPTDADNDAFILVYQTGFQQRMLRLYGNNSFGIDGTYKTLKYGFSMYFIVVLDNSKMAQIAATFILPRETADHIVAGLKVICEWNPD